MNPTRDPHEYRVYGDDMAQTWCIVDEVDYQWAIQWRWHINKPHPVRSGTKQYFCRSNGSGGRRRGPRLLLHVEIMKRMGIVPPDAQHTLVAHLDDNEWNCRRENLAWTTSQKNRVTSHKANAAFAALNKRRKLNDQKQA